MIDDDLRAGIARGQVREDVGQLAEPQLGGSTTAPRELGQADRGLGFGRHGRTLAHGRMMRCSPTSFPSAWMLGSLTMLIGTCMTAATL